MANTYLTMKNIAREALPILVNNLVFPNLVHQDYSNDFVGMGDTIQVKKPPIYTAKDFDGTIDVQDATFGSVDVKMDKIADVSLEVTSKELALTMPQFCEQVIEPMAAAIAEKINAEGLELAKDIPYISGVAGTTPDDLDDFASIRKSLNERGVPSTKRCAVWDVDADSKFASIDALVKVNESGGADALREGEIGRVFGMDNYYSGAVYNHVSGSAVNTTSPKVNGAVSSGATIISVDATSMTGKLLAGDLLTIGDYTYVVTADTDDASSNAINNVAIYPAVQADISDNDAVTFVGDSVRNVGFHKNAFAFVSRALPLPAGADAYVVSYGGITLRVVRSYDITHKKEIMSMDVLYGYKTVYPELHM